MAPSSPLPRSQTSRTYPTPLARERVRVRVWRGVIPSPALTDLPGMAGPPRAGEGQGEGVARHRLTPTTPQEASATRCASVDDTAAPSSPLPRSQTSRTYPMPLARERVRVRVWRAIASPRPRRKKRRLHAARPLTTRRHRYPLSRARIRLHPRGRCERGRGDRARRDQTEAVHMPAVVRNAPAIG